MHQVKRVVTVALMGVLAGLLAMPVAAQARSDEPVSPAKVGQLTLFSRPDFTGTAQRIVYPQCTPRTIRVGPVVGSFDNQPPAGCQVVLLTSRGQFPLCDGRGVVPQPMRNAISLRIQPGVSRPCPPLPLDA